MGVVDELFNDSPSRGVAQHQRVREREPSREVNGSPGRCGDEIALVIAGHRAERQHRPVVDGQSPLDRAPSPISVIVGGDSCQFCVAGCGRSHASRLVALDRTGTLETTFWSFSGGCRRAGTLGAQFWSFSGDEKP